MKRIITWFLLLMSFNLYAQKISQLPTATGTGTGGFIPIVQGGITKKISSDSLIKPALNYADSLKALLVIPINQNAINIATNAAAIQQRTDSLRNNAGILEAKKGGVFVPQFTLPTGGSSSDSLFNPIWERKGVAVTSPPVYPDDNSAQEPTVILDINPQILTGTDSIFKMWGTVGIGNVGIAYWESYTGYPGTWVRYSSRVLPNVLHSSVFKDSTTYYLYGVIGSPSTVVAQYTSINGINWTKAHDSVLVASNVGAGRLDNTFVFKEGSIWKMLVDYSPGLEYSVAYFTSTNGFTFTAPAPNPVVKGLGMGGPFVKKIGANYYLWVHGVGGFGGNLPSDAVVYKSPDLINWSLMNTGFFLRRRTTDEGQNIITGQVADLFLLPVKDSVYMYYSATRDGLNFTDGFRIKFAVAKIRFDSLVKTNQNDVTYSNHALAVGNEVVHALPGTILYVGENSNLEAIQKNLFYNSRNNRLGIGTSTPLSKFHFQSDTSFSRSYFGNNFTGSPQTDIAIGKNDNTGTLFVGVNYGNVNNSYLDNQSNGDLLLKTNGVTNISLNNSGINFSSPVKIDGVNNITFDRTSSTTLNRSVYQTAGVSQFYYGRRAINDLSLTSATFGIYQISQSTGNVFFGSEFDASISTVDRMTVAGSIAATQYKLSALNTAPVSSTDTGTLGETRVTAGFIYVCTATNTWVRAALTTW